MKSASQAIYECYKTLPPPDEGLCFLCGGSAFDAQPFKFPPTFTDFDVARGDMGVCIACRFLMDEKNAVVQEKTVKDKLQRARNYSHFVVDDEWLILSKAHKAAMRELLTQDYIPGVAIVAVSGQKHLAFKAKVNPPESKAGWVQFEEQCLWVDAFEFSVVMEHVQKLYQQHSKDAILSGRYTFYPDTDLALWRQNENAIRTYRDSALLELAVYLATKDDNDG